MTAWAVEFWALRSAIGSEETDQLIAQTYRVMMDNPLDDAGSDPNLYLLHKIKLANSVLDSRAERWSTIRGVFQKAGITADDSPIRELSTPSLISRVSTITRRLRKDDAVWVQAIREEDRVLAFELSRSVTRSERREIRQKFAQSNKAVRSSLEAEYRQAYGNEASLLRGELLRRLQRATVTQGPGAFQTPMQGERPFAVAADHLDVLTKTLLRAER